MKLNITKIFLGGVCLMPFILYANEPGLAALTVTTGKNGAQQYSLSLQILALMTLLTLLPAFVIMMTSFTRIVIVLGILRQALGLGQTPTNQILLGIALFLTVFIMMPVFNTVNSEALQPYLDEKIDAQAALNKAATPVKQFMLKQTRKTDLSLFKRIAQVDKKITVADTPFTVVVPAFVTSELKTAFQMGFVLFIPFLIIDLVVSSILMAMGMMMLSPVIVSLPFKIMLFVLIDGWTLVVGTLASSFQG